MSSHSTSPRSDGRRLSQVARHVIVPDGAVSSIWPKVDRRIREFGDEFDLWQADLSTLILSIDEHGLFSATVGGVVISIARQVAKTWMIGRLMLAICTLFPNVTVLWTAHKGRTADRTFQALRAICGRKAMAKYLMPTRGTSMDGIRVANGGQEIRFKNGSAILFGAREHGFGLGFSEVDFVVFDEAQRLTERAVADMVPPTNQSKFEHGALVFFMGTPPRPYNQSSEFKERRKDALAPKGDSTDVVFQGGDMLYVECSADPDVGEPDGPDLMDEDQWRKANPSYPLRTPRASMMRMRRNLKSDDSWRREALGVWDGDGVTFWQGIDKRGWEDAVGASPSEPGGVTAFGVKFSTDGHRISCAGAYKPSDGTVFIESLGVSLAATGTTQLVDYLSQAENAYIVIDGRSGATDLRDSLIAAGLRKSRVSVATWDSVSAYHAAFTRALADGNLRHPDQPGLNEQARIATRKPVGNAGGWKWTSLLPESATTALEAATLAFGLANRQQIRTGKVLA